MAAVSKGIGLHLGLNSVDPKAYEGWDGPLAACENDARDMAALAKSQGLASTVLLTKKATRAATLAGLRSACKALKSGDLLLLKVWDHGAYKGSYMGFHARIKARMPASQTPNLFTLGRVGAFATQKPFTLQAPGA